MNLWLKNPETGQMDVLETLSVYAVGAVLIKFMLADVAFGSFSSANLDGGTIAAILTPTLGSLAFKKNSDNNTKNKGS